MLPIRLRIQGIGPYIDETIDFSGIPGDVVAIIGENGSGKTMLVDSIFAALYRYLPSRPEGIYKFCTTKDASLSFDFMARGSKYRTEIKINAKSREMEPWLFIVGPTDEALTPLSDGKNSTFDKAISTLVGPPEAALASVFASQNRTGSFTSLKPAKRKELFIEMLGLSRLQVVSDEAGRREEEAKKQYAALSDRVPMLEASAALKDLNLDDMKANLEGYRSRSSFLESEITRINRLLVDINANLMFTKDVHKEAEPAQAKLRTLDREQKEVSRAIADAEKLVANLASLRISALDCEPLERELAGFRESLNSLSNQESAYHRVLGQYNQSVRVLEREIATLKSSVAQYDVALSRAGIDSQIIGTVPCLGIGECAECQFLVNAVKSRESIADFESNRDDANAKILDLEEKIKNISRPKTQELTDILANKANMQTKITGHDAKLKIALGDKNSLVKAEAASANLEAFKSRLEKITKEQEDQNAIIDRLSKNPVKPACESRM